MTDRPIIFSGPMVRALLDGRKTMTRRLASSPLEKVQVGDRLYVRENWRADDFAEEDPDRTIFMADADADALKETRGIIKWRPCIHHPRNRSRITLIVTAKKTERLQGISSDDCIAEGAGLPIGKELVYGSVTDAWNVRAFASLWSRLHGADSWNANPEVIAISFRAVKANIDRAEAA